MIKLRISTTLGCYSTNSLKNGDLLSVIFFQSFRAVSTRAFERIQVSLYQVKRLLKLQAPSRPALYILKQRTKNPSTFNTKILYKIANDRNPSLTLFADKIKVREYVASRIGKGYFTEIYEEFRSPSTFSIDNLPRNFVLKPNHVSGAALLVGDFVAKDPSQQIYSNSFLKKYYSNPDCLEHESTKKLVQFWFKTNFYGYHKAAYPEWAYKNITPVVYAEELLVSDSQPPQDFRFFTFNGKCEVVMVDTPGFVGVTRDVFSTNWERLDVQFGHPTSGIQRLRPAELVEMIKIAELLAHGTDHLRVDLYNLNGRIIFSELTNYHAGGTQEFVPPGFDYELGKNWHPETQY
jgi:hypothetical protein